eukprot:5330414-Lingulodinium_polyedra.AAC.1
MVHLGHPACRIPGHAGLVSPLLPGARCARWRWQAHLGARVLDRSAAWGGDYAGTDGFPYEA